MANAFGKASRANLDKVHPDLVKLHEAVLPIMDHTITDGIRSIDEQKKNVAKGVSQTMDSKHLPQSDGLSHATDSTPFPHDWQATQRGLDAIKKADPTLSVLRFYYFQGVMRGVAHQLGIPIRQGIDWDRDGDVGDQSFVDLPHNELLPKETP